MAKFSFKRPRIISKRFQGMDSTIDGVTKSLHDLVFSYTERVDKSLQKKHVMMAMSSLVLLIVLGSFISPKGKAESSIFYPDTCLGGWVNPQYAQGEQQTTSNGDESQFTKDNSAVLPKNTNAEMYCGNFRGKFDSATLPTKIIVSLALTKGADLLPEDVMESGLATTTPKEVDTSVATTSESILATSSIFSSSSTESNAMEVSSTSIASTTQQEATSTPIVSPEEPPSVVDGIVESLKDTIDILFNTHTKSQTGTTDTVVVPPPTEEPKAPVPPEEPTSLFPSFYEQAISPFFIKVFAQEEGSTTPADLPPIEVSESSSSSAPVEEVAEPPATKEESVAPQPAPGELPTLLEALTNIILVASSTEATTTITASTTEATTTIEELITATTTEENQFQNNFLEVFYTFDGVTWISLGELNEISMKYRTFEIPVTASTSWDDMSRLQIKVIAKKDTEDTPTVYLDAIKVEVLYETTLVHAHPDFARDTILNDETIDGMRIVTIINNETNQEEIWYMYLDEASTTGVVASSTIDNASTTITSSTTLPLETKSTEGTSTLLEATTTATTTSPTIKPVRQKNIWIKFEGAKEDSPTGQRLRELILQEDKEKDIQEEEEKRELPDFTRDVVKKIKGTLFNVVVVQLAKNNHEELWMYDIGNETPIKINNSSSTSLAVDSPLGAKGEYIFWVSEDGSHIFAYNVTTKDIKEQSIPAHDISKGERGEITFEHIPWKVIIGSEGFLFWSEQTGEVFSDDNGSIAEVFRHEHKLDTFLSKDVLSNFNFQVEEIENEE